MNREEEAAFFLSTEDFVKLIYSYGQALDDLGQYLHRVVDAPALNQWRHYEPKSISIVEQIDFVPRAEEDDEKFKLNEALAADWRHRVKGSDHAFSRTGTLRFNVRTLTVRPLSIGHTMTVVDDTHSQYFELTYIQGQRVVTWQQVDSHHLKA